jgi:hypothetical protein
LVGDAEEVAAVAPAAADEAVDVAGGESTAGGFGEVAAALLFTPAGGEAAAATSATAFFGLWEFVFATSPVEPCCCCCWFLGESEGSTRTIIAILISY